jgi:predicted MPP superfamily phosphohydrolase
LTPAQEGTPLEEVPFLTVSQIAELKGLNVYTLEQLAGIADTHSRHFMGFNSMKQKAVAYLESAKSAAPITAMKLELEKRDAEIEVLKQQVAKLMEANKTEA